jgi:ribosomal protein S2
MWPDDVNLPIPMPDNQRKSLRLSMQLLYNAAVRNTESIALMLAAISVAVCIVLMFCDRVDYETDNEYEIQDILQNILLALYYSSLASLALVLTGRSVWP